MSDYLIARTSWLADMECLSDSERGRLFTALLNFAASGEKQEPRGSERVLFYKFCAEAEANCANFVQMHKDDVQMHNIYINNSSNTLTQVSNNGIKNYTDSFNRFWDSYPSKVNKKRALEVWKKIKPDDDLVETMLKSIDAWKRTRKWMSGYVPNPDTWLRGENWNDEIPAEPSSRRSAIDIGERPRMTYEDVNAIDLSAWEDEHDGY